MNESVIIINKKKIMAAAVFIRRDQVVKMAWLR